MEKQLLKKSKPIQMEGLPMFCTLPVTLVALLVSIHRNHEQDKMLYLRMVT
ncbi:Uncharacterised protein [Serratia quinivorans]|nr:Uncharacterised protein [Serratia quinivorans]CAI0886515.1 Uncharacterised protein [Serratia quinivorans]CAI1503473.1 Uncharacterised protein [Serratia quinivorans]CAI2049002.1 Uncharacterised protein [Serratia quinivorans]CAI2083191.1 Uncharacterised protein [Serratia quinivorans]